MPALSSMAIGFPSRDKAMGARKKPQTAVTYSSLKSTAPPTTACLP